MAGKIPFSKWLFSSLDRENEMGVEIRSKNLPEIPQWENCDFFVNLIILAVSKGLVLIDSH